MSIHRYCILFFLLINTLLVSLLSVFVEILFLQSQKGQGLVTDHWSSGSGSVLSPLRPDLSLWPGTETPLQAAAG